MNACEIESQISEIKPLFRNCSRVRRTTYRDTEFRSELQAAWACFFDIREIVYESDPMLALETWRPVFYIQPPDSVAEVKPYMNLAQWKTDTATLDMIRSWFVGEFTVTLLGASPLMKSNFELTIGPDLKFEELPFGDPREVARDWMEARSIVRKQE
jgi:hypothetical protein